MSSTRAIVAVFLFTWVTGLSGCGSLGDAALQTGEASLRTIVDLLLTDFANQVADSFEDQPSDDVDGMDGMNGDGNGDGMDDDPVARGESLVADNCAACHGADGASGFAPNIQGSDAMTLGDAAAGVGGHTVIELSEEQIADIEAYLASF